VCRGACTQTRGAGLGRLLLREIARLAFQLSCVNVQWQTPVWNTRAISFYQHLGAEGKQKVRFFFAGDALETFLE
jgi:ribosomal protein S18 acetylase RimI-like enzyme